MRGVAGASVAGHAVDLEGVLDAGQHDGFGSQRGEAAYLVHGGQRVASLVIYLNDVDAGGETVFPQVGLSIAPAKGSAVYFAYTDAQSRCDPLSFHGGAPVERGEKWIATRWMRELPFP